MQMLHLHLSARLEVFLNTDGPEYPYVAQITGDDTQRVGYGPTPRAAILNALPEPEPEAVAS